MEDCLKKKEGGCQLRLGKARNERPVGDGAEPNRAASRERSAEVDRLGTTSSDCGKDGGCKRGKRTAAEDVGGGVQCGGATIEGARVLSSGVCRLNWLDVQVGVY